MSFLSRLAFWRRPEPLALAAPSDAAEIERRARELAAVIVRSIEGGGTVPMRQNNRAIWTDWKTSTAVSDGFKATVWVYVCAMKVAQSVAMVPMRAQRHTGKGWEFFDQPHPLDLLLQKPNAHMGRRTFMERVMLHLLLGGNGIALKNRGMGQVPLELWPTIPDRLKPVPSRTNYISHYEHTIDGLRQADQPTEDVLHWMDCDPSNPFWGLSRLQAAARAVDTDVDALTWQKCTLQNMAMPSGALVDPQHYSWEQFVDEKKKIEAAHVGSTNGRKIIYLDGGRKFESMMLTPAELDFIQSRKFTREEICSAFGVPPPVVGIFDQATYNNIETARKIFWEDTVLLYADAMANGFTRALAPDFGDDLRVVPDTSEIAILNQLTKDAAETAEKFHRMGVPFNVINRRMRLGFPEIPGGDEGFVPGTMTPISALTVDTFGNDA